MNSSGRRVVMIVEDSRPILSSLGGLFRHVGVDTILCPTIDAGLKNLSDPEILSTIDAIITDIMLPDGSGELILLAALGMGKPIRIVACSGMTSFHELDKLRTMGASIVLQKPADFRDLYLAAFPHSVLE